MSGFGKIVIATDKFKGSMTAVQASEAVRDGITEGCKETGRTMPQNGGRRGRQHGGNGKGPSGERQKLS